MAAGFVAKSFTVALLLLSLCSSSSLGIFVGFSYEAREKGSTTRRPTGANEFLETNMQFIALSKSLAFLDYVSSTGIFVNILFDKSQDKELPKSLYSANLWARKALHRMNICKIIFSSSEEGLPLFLSTLHSVQSVLTAIDHYPNIKASAMFSLPVLEMLVRNSEKSLQSITTSIIQSKSFIMVEVFAERDLSLGNGFIRHVIQKAIIACSHLPNHKILIVLNLKNFLPDPNGISVAEFMEKMSNSIEINPHVKYRILGLLVPVPCFKSFRRKLLREANMPTSFAKVAIHDTYLNPTTTPITVPSTLRTTIVTIPATNPVTVLPTSPSTNPMTPPITVPSSNPFPTPITNPLNPTNAPITVPATYPMPDPFTNPANTPITVPSTNPIPNPVTNPATNPSLPPPVMPVTNPVTTPTTNPANQPVTNSPFSPPIGASPVNNPITNPGTVPVSPTGQTWCVAKSGLPDSALQLALDYACGMGGADCSAIQVAGSCYNPNTLQAHASYAFNSYYQRNPVPSSCDFGGTAMIVTVNPSTTACVYPLASSASGNPSTGLNPASGLNPATGLNPTSGFSPTSGFNPPSTTTSDSGSGSGSAAPNNSAEGSSSSSVFGSNNTSGSVSSSSVSLLVGLALPIFLLTSSGNIC